MPAQERQQQPMGAKALNHDIDGIYGDWDDARSKNDAAALLKLYAPAATLESPPVTYLWREEEGICRGREELKKLFEILATRKPKVRQFYRTGYFTDGRKIMWEYPQETPTGQQMDFVEVMEIENGLIQKHRVYRGWYGFNVLKTDRYHH